MWSVLRSVLLLFALASCAVDSGANLRAHVNKAVSPSAVGQNQAPHAIDTGRFIYCADVFADGVIAIRAEMAKLEADLDKQFAEMKMEPGSAQRLYKITHRNWLYSWHDDYMRCIETGFFPTVKSRPKTDWGRLFGAE